MRTIFPPGAIQPVFCRARAESFDAVTFVGAGHAIRRAAWDGYDEALFFCWEEFDFCLRAIERGWRIRYRGDIAVRHKVCPDRRVTWSGTRWFQFVRNRLYIEHKWGAGWFGLLPRMAYYLIRGMRNGVLRQTLRALPAAIRLSSGVAVRHHSASAQRYLLRNDAPIAIAGYPCCGMPATMGFASLDPSYAIMPRRIVGCVARYDRQPADCEPLAQQIGKIAGLSIR